MIYMLSDDKRPVRRRRKGNNGLSSFFDQLHEFEEWKNMEEKKKKEKGPPKARTFTFLETWGISMTLGPVAILFYLYGMQLIILEIAKLAK